MAEEAGLRIGEFSRGEIDAHELRGGIGRVCIRHRTRHDAIHGAADVVVGAMGHEDVLPHVTAEFENLVDPGLRDADEMIIGFLDDVDQRSLLAGVFEPEAVLEEGLGGALDAGMQRAGVQNQATIDDRS